VTTDWTWVLVEGRKLARWRHERVPMGLDSPFQALDIYGYAALSGNPQIVEMDAAVVLLWSSRWLDYLPRILLGEDFGYPPPEKVEEFVIQCLAHYRRGGIDLTLTAPVCWLGPGPSHG